MELAGVVLDIPQVVVAGNLKYNGYWVLVILYLILFKAIDKHDQSAGICK